MNNKIVNVKRFIKKFVNVKFGVWIKNRNCKMVYEKNGKETK